MMIKDKETWQGKMKTSTQWPGYKVRRGNGNFPANVRETR